MKVKRRKWVGCDAWEFNGERFSIFHSPSSTFHPPSSILRTIRRFVPLILLDALLVAFSFYLALPMRFAGTPPDPFLDALRSLVPFIS